MKEKIEVNQVLFLVRVSAIATFEGLSVWNCVRLYGPMTEYRSENFGSRVTSYGTYMDILVPIFT